MPSNVFSFPQTLATMIAQARYQPTGRSQSTPVMPSNMRSNLKQQQFKAEVDLSKALETYQKLTGKDPESIKRKQSEALLFNTAYQTMKMIDPNSAEAMRKQFEPKFKEWSEVTPGAFFLDPQGQWQVAPINVDKKTLEGAFAYMVGSKMPDYGSQMKQQSQQQVTQQPMQQPQMTQPIQPAQQPTQPTQPTQMNPEELVKSWISQGQYPFSSIGENQIVTQQPVTQQVEQQKTEQQVPDLGMMANLPSMKDVSNIENMETAIDVFLNEGRVTREKMKYTKEGALLQTIDSISKSHPLLGYSLTASVFGEQAKPLGTKDILQLMRLESIAKDPYYYEKSIKYQEEVNKLILEQGLQKAKIGTEKVKQLKYVSDIEKNEIEKVKLHYQTEKEKFDAALKKFEVEELDKTGIPRSLFNEINKTLTDVPIKIGEYATNRLIPNDQKFVGLLNLYSSIYNTTKLLPGSSSVWQSVARNTDNLVANTANLLMDKESEDSIIKNRSRFEPSMKIAISSIIEMSPFLEPRTIEAMVPLLAKFGYTPQEIAEEFAYPTMARLRLAATSEMRNAPGYEKRMEMVQNMLTRSIMSIMTRR